MNVQTTAKMLDRYVSKGGNRENGAELLAEGFKNHNGHNLAYFLHYYGFATINQAYKVVAA